jgi:hypothetical protein
MPIEMPVHRGAFIAYSFDSLGYAKRLRGGGVPQEQAEAHAEAARDFIMAELVTKSDLLATKQELQNSILVTKQELQSTIETLKSNIETVKNSLETRITNLETRIDTLGLRLTLRLGAIVVVGIGVLATLLKLI